MTKRFILVLLIICLPSIASARDRIVGVQSISIPPYEAAVKGFSSVCSAPMDRLLLSGTGQPPLNDQIISLKPDLILAVGLDAFKALDSIRDIPIVYVMLICPKCDIKGRTNITGVNMSPSAEVQLRKIREILPGIRTVGVLFNPAQSGQFIENARAEAGSLKLDLLAEPIDAVREVPSTLLTLRDRAELIWMIPDITVVTPQTMEVFILFSLENKIPLAVFSEKYLDTGAFMAFGLSAEDMGRQAGEMANRILSGTRPDKLPAEDARSVSVTVNGTMAKKFGIRIDKTLLKKFGRME